MNLDDDILIGDESVTSFCNTDIESLTLTDFINDMKSWANKISKYKQEHWELWHILKNQYQGLATWHEYNLLTNERLKDKELEDKLYSDFYLSSLKPHADLSVATHSFIKHHFYPRLGYLWREIAPSADHLWFLFEYSLFAQQVHEKTDGTIITTKTLLLKKLDAAIKGKQQMLEEIDYSLSPKPPVLSKRQHNNIEVKEKIARVENFFITTEKYFQEIKKNLITKLHKLVLVQSQLEILKSGNRNFLSHYQKYLNEWDIYRQTVKNSPHFQVFYLNSDGTELEHSKRGRPKSVKKAEGIPALQNKNMNQVSAMECPSCRLTHIRRNGKQPGGKQKYICVNCKHQFINA